MSQNLTYQFANWLDLNDFVTSYLRIFNVILELPLKWKKTKPKKDNFYFRWMSIFIFWYPKVYIWMCTNHYARKSLMGTKKQKVRVEYLAMKIQLSPVTISPSMYIPLPLPHMPTKITKTRSNGLLQAARTSSPPLTLSTLAIFSPFWEISPCHKIVSLRLFPKFSSRLLNALRIECSVSTNDYQEYSCAGGFWVRTKLRD